jgi:hypothetical protein
MSDLASCDCRRYVYLRASVFPSFAPLTSTRSKLVLVRVCVPQVYLPLSLLRPVLLLRPGAVHCQLHWIRRVPNSLILL